MSKLTIELIQQNELLELLNQASTEAILFTLKLEKTDYPENALLFLEMWNEGLWDEINENFSEFDLNTPAQKALMKESGWSKSYE